MIDSFTGEFRWLSNFYPSPIKYEGIIYPSVEHAYQAAKVLDRSKRKQFLHIKPGEAKRLGKRVRLREDWEKVRFGIMEDLLRLKFTRHADLKEKLLETGNEELIEGNNWSDFEWGVCNGRGKNHLGRLLMKVRDSLRNGAATDE